MKKRLVVEMLLTLVITLVIGMWIGGRFKADELKAEIQAEVWAEMREDRQQYATNAYNLGILEFTAVSTMPPEEAAKVQELIHQAMEQELSLEEQEKVWNRACQDNCVNLYKYFYKW